VFDLLMRDGKDCRRESLLDRKQKLRRLLGGSDARIQYVDYVDGRGVPLFEQSCQHDLEGIVTKQSRRRDLGQPLHLFGPARPEKASESAFA
jgi:bifunctional non-homologous end joining protein LigD